jgi:hypothetical protein
MFLSVSISIDFTFLNSFFKYRRKRNGNKNIAITSNSDSSLHLTVLYLSTVSTAGFDGPMYSIQHLPTDGNRKQGQENQLYPRHCTA